MSISINIVILMLLVWGIYALLDWVTVFESETADFLLDIGGTAVASMIAYLIFPLLLPLIVSFFDSYIAEHIERKDYPTTPTPEPPFWPTILHDVKFTLKALAINLVLLPFLLIPFINFFMYFVYIGVNGYLLGSEFFHMAAGRHVDFEQGQALKRRHRFGITLGGMAITFASTIPIVNLVSPVWGVALMVHFFHALKPNYKIMIVEEGADSPPKQLT